MSRCDYLSEYLYFLDTPWTDENHDSLMLDVVNQPDILTDVNADTAAIFTRILRETAIFPMMPLKDLL